MAAVGWDKRLTSMFFSNGSGRILEASYVHESTSIVRLTIMAAVGWEKRLTSMFLSMAAVGKSVLRP